MVTGPRDEVPGTARHGRLRAAHADRERVVEVLKAAFVQGRLDQGELEARVDRALASRTYAELAALTADIPAEPAPRRPARVPNQALPSHPFRNGAIGVGVCLALAVACVWDALILQNRLGFVLVMVAGVLVMFGVPLSLWDATVTVWEQWRSRRALPPGPGDDGHTPDDRRSRHDPTRPGARPDGTQADMRPHRSRARRAIRRVPDAHPA